MDGKVIGTVDWPQASDPQAKKLTVIASQYISNGRPALELVNADGEHYMTATVNISDEPLAEGETIIKDYSENRGVFDALVKAKLVVPAGRMVRTGFVKCPVVRVVGLK